ncbi:MAG: sulfite exporter TauE/SafE family protein [bacterium]|nr:sulfite exporter TauE/SafE family protein [bacterium]
MLFLTAFLTGLFGSFHCAGMCGPIAFALPGSASNGAKFYLGRLLYNFGRMFSYALLGLVFGAFGLGLKLAGWQQSVSIAAGIFILFIVLYQYYFKKGSFFNILSLFSSSAVKKLFGSKNIWALFGIGMVNGFLPCGFVYIAILGASTTQDLFYGALFMLCFGLGTLPMMFGVSIIGQFISSGIRQKLNKLSPVFAILIAILFILRGLNLGIPYVSPVIATDQEKIENCDSH